MAVFADTSGFLAFLQEREIRHVRATEVWKALMQRGEEVLTHSYVMVETVSLLQRRYGFDKAEAFLDGLLPAIGVHMVDGPLHDQAVAAFRAAGSRSVSLVDRVSFAFMRRLGIRHVFGFDADFLAEGFLEAGSQ